MASINQCPLMTVRYETPGLFNPEPCSAYVFGFSNESRSTHVKEWKGSTTSIDFIEVVEETEGSFTARWATGRKTFSLRSDMQMASFWSDVQGSPVYLDITGLPHHIWAPLMKSYPRAKRDLRVTYVEPADYTISPAPIEGQIFDLSERISGVAPIPGFTSLVDMPEEKTCFIPILGFEGNRFKYVIEQVEPSGGKVFPIIGVPGFRPEYPFYAYHANKSVLSSTRCWRDVQYATANCPFSLYYVLQELRRKFPDDLLKVAPIGTKPHSLGAVLFNITSAGPVELVYDHPIRKAERSTEAGRLFVYNISAFV